MSARLTSLFILVLLAGPVLADTVALTEDHPDRYTVVKGDTLWDISARFLKDPWRWASVWNKNEQIKNPHRIYPGDVIVLTYRNGQPELSVLPNEKLTPVTLTEPGSSSTTTTTSDIPDDGFTGQVVKLSPEPHAESLDDAIPTIKPEAIQPFLSRPLAIEKHELDKAGYVTIGLDNRLALGDQSEFYARGLGEHPAEYYQIFRPGKALRDPNSGEILAYEALYLGDAKLLEPGDPSKLKVTLVKQEILPGDRMLATGQNLPLPYYLPHAPNAKVRGSILAAINGVAELGPQAIVAINLGQRDGVDAGTVLRIMRHAGKDRDPVTKRMYRLPDEESGLLMIFRPYEKVSYALVMRATQAIHIDDTVQTP